MAAVASPAASPRTDHARRLFAGIARDYDRMGALLSFGQDARWRRFLVGLVPPRSRVLDVATGTGLVARELTRRRGADVVGLDASAEMLASGGNGRRWPAVLARAERLPFPDGTFDAVTLTYLLRYVDDPTATLSELARVVRPGGILASLEFFVPTGRVRRAAWRGYTRIGLPALGALGGRAWMETGRFLGPSIEDFARRYPLAEQVLMWRAAGLGDIGYRVMSLGAGVVAWGTKRER